MDLEDAVEEIARETTEINYRLKAVEDEVQNLSKIDIVEEIKELKELVKYILTRMKLAPPSSDSEDD